jgi:hypothetical protein
MIKRDPAASQWAEVCNAVRPTRRLACMFIPCKRACGIDASSDAMDVALCNSLGPSAARSAVSCTHDWCWHYTSMGMVISFCYQHAVRSPALPFAHDTHAPPPQGTAGGTFWQGAAPMHLAEQRLQAARANVALGMATLCRCSNTMDICGNGCVCASCARMPGAMVTACRGMG